MESGNIVVDLHAQHPAGHPRLFHALRRASAPRAKIAHALDERLSPRLRWSSRARTHICTISSAASSQVEEHVLAA